MRSEDRYDSELRDLLHEWKAPAFPASLEPAILRPRRSWTRFLLHGYIRVPVPLAACLAMAVLFGAWRFSAHAEAYKACLIQNAAAHPISGAADACKNAMTGC